MTLVSAELVFRRLLFTWRVVSATGLIHARLLILLGFSEYLLYDHISVIVVAVATSVSLDSHGACLTSIEFTFKLLGIFANEVARLATLKDILLVLNGLYVR